MDLPSVPRRRPGRGHTGREGYGECIQREAHQCVVATQRRQFHYALAAEPRDSSREASVVDTTAYHELAGERVDDCLVVGLERWRLAASDGGNNRVVDAIL